MDSSFRSLDFTGTERITILVKTECPCLFINHKALTFIKLSLSTPDTSKSWTGKAGIIVSHAVEVATEFVEDTAKLTFELTPIPSGTYNLDIEYAGKVSEGNKGFYRAVDPRYSRHAPGGTEEELVQNSVLTTTFEPVFAREAFPCFDEPALKAVFQAWSSRLS